VRVSVTIPVTAHCKVYTYGAYRDCPGFVSVEIVRCALCGTGTMHVFEPGARAPWSDRPQHIQFQADVNTDARSERAYSEHVAAAIDIVAKRHAGALRRLAESGD